MLVSAGQMRGIILPNKQNKLHERGEERFQVIDEPWRAARAQVRARFNFGPSLPPPLSPLSSFHQQHSSGCTRTTRTLFTVHVAYSRSVGCKTHTGTSSHLFPPLTSNPLLPGGFLTPIFPLTPLPGFSFPDLIRIATDECFSVSAPFESPLSCLQKTSPPPPLSGGHRLATAPNCTST